MSKFITKTNAIWHLNDFLRIYHHNTHLCSAGAEDVLRTTYRFGVGVSLLLSGCEFPKKGLCRNLNLSLFYSLYWFYKLGWLQLLSAQVDMYATNKILVNTKNDLLKENHQATSPSISLMSPSILGKNFM